MDPPASLLVGHDGDGLFDEVPPTGVDLVASQPSLPEPPGWQDPQAAVQRSWHDVYRDMQERTNRRW